MTDATDTPHSIIDRVADRFGVDVETLPQREPGAAAARLRAIAAIHALAEWFVEHPDVPAPEDVHATFRVDTIGELAVHAHLLDEQPYAGGRQFGIVVAGSPIEGDVYVQVFGAVRRPDQPF